MDLRRARALAPAPGGHGRRLPAPGESAESRKVGESMRFDAEYVACVLNENFEDAKAQFLAPLMRIHYAHLVMLAEQGIVPPGDAHAIRTALDGISAADVEDVRYDGTCEDLFFFVERLII